VTVPAGFAAADGTPYDAITLLDLTAEFTEPWNLMSQLGRRTFLRCLCHLCRCGGSGRTLAVPALHGEANVEGGTSADTPAAGEERGRVYPFLMRPSPNRRLQPRWRREVPLAFPIGRRRAHITSMLRVHPHAEATYSVVPLSDGTFEVEVIIPETHPTRIRAFATEADAGAWIATHKVHVQLNVPYRRVKPRGG
jgi:hypothetical protein